jgi:predicted nuclease with TOPRIM domain
MEIEKRFEEQNQIIEQLKSDNNQLENAFHERQIEIMNLQEQINDSNSPQNQQK